MLKGRVELKIGEAQSATPAPQSLHCWRGFV